MRRWPQVVLIVSTLLGSWFCMQAVHEVGHVFGAWLTRGVVTNVVLHPLTIPRTDLSDNPDPLFVVWAGPIFGVLAPLVIWVIAVATKLPGAFVFRFFAGFCLIANGLYIAVGSLDGVGDCGQMLRHGSAMWQLWLFGAVTAPVGLLLWHRQGSHFGLGAAADQVDQRVAMASLVTCVALIVVGFLVGE